MERRGASARPLTGTLDGIAVLVVTACPSCAAFVTAGPRSAASSARYEVRHAEDVQAALVALAHTPFAAVIIDLRPASGVPLDGVVAVRAAARRSALIVLAGPGGEDLARRALDSGADDSLLISTDEPTRELELLVAGAIARSELRETEQRLGSVEGDLLDVQVRMRAMLDHIPLAIFQTDLQGRYVHASATAAEMTGRSPEELVGRTPDELFAPAIAAATNRDEQAVRELEEAITFETSAEMRGIPAHDYRITKYPIHDADRSLIGVGSLVLDVTELRRAESSAAHLAEIIASAAVAVIGFATDGTITSWNPAAERLYGYTADEVLGRGIELLAPPGPAPEFKANRELIIAGQPSVELEAVRRRRDGTDIDVAVTLSPHTDPTGAIVGFSAIVRDIAAQRAMRVELEASEERLRTTIDNAPVGIALLAADGRTLRVNRKLSELLRYDEDELLAMRWEALCHHDDVEQGAELVAQMRAGEIAAFELEKRLIRSDGSIILSELHVSLVRDAAGEPAHFVAQVLDISSRKADEARLRAQAREQAALTEVATLVASDANPRAVFAAAARRVAGLLDADFALVVRLEAGGENRVVGAWSNASVPGLGLGAAFDIAGESPIQVANARAMGAAEVRRPTTSAGHRALAEPVTVNGRLWGSVSVGWAHDRSSDPQAPARLSRFAHLVSLAITGSEAREQLARLASTDHLTGLYNRRAFSDRLAADVAGARRHGRALSVAIFDLDNFKRVNDTYGHGVGDRVLAEFAGRLTAHRREGDVIARIGGEEFACILPDTDLHGALTRVERVRRMTARAPFEDVGTVTTSVGVSELADAPDANELFRRADVALYQAKDRGRDTVCCWSPQAPGGEAIAAADQPLRRARFSLGRPGRRPSGRIAGEAEADAWRSTAA